MNRVNSLIQIHIFFYFLLISCNQSLDRGYYFIGDSHVELWHTSFYFGNEDVQNLGVGGYRINNVINQLENVVIDSPQEAIIQIGYNDISDLSSLNASIEDRVEILVERYNSLMSVLSSKFSKITFLSVIPHSASFLEEDARELTKTINVELEELCSALNVPFIDISSGLEDSDGYLNPFFSTEGIHLNVLGYDRISQKCYEIF